MSANVTITRDELDRLLRVVDEAQATLQYFAWLSTTARMITRADIQCVPLKVAVNAVGTIQPHEVTNHVDSKRTGTATRGRKRITA